MRLTAFIFTSTGTTFQCRLPVKHIVSLELEPKWNFRNFKTPCLAKHLSPNKNFCGSILLTSWGVKAYQNFQNQSHYRILQFFPDIRYDRKYAMSLYKMDNSKFLEFPGPIYEKPPRRKNQRKEHVHMQKKGARFRGRHSCPHRRCSGILCWNCPHVQVVSAEASSKQVALALTIGADDLHVGTISGFN